MPDINSILLSTKIKEDKFKNENNETIQENEDAVTQDIKLQNKIEQQEEKELIPNNIIATNTNRDYINEFKNIMVKKQVSALLNSKTNKRIFSVTEIIKCPKFLWYSYKGKITKDMIDYGKIFHLLNLYGVMGTAAHNFIYKNMKFETIEFKITDKTNHIVGKYDTLDHGHLIDIKSSYEKYDVSPQLSLYYYLAAVHDNVHINKVSVWWVIQDKMEEYDIGKLKELYPVYLKRANNLYEELKKQNYNKDILGIDENYCKYCLLKKWCKNNDIPSKTKRTNNDTKNENKKPTKEIKSDDDGIMMML